MATANWYECNDTAAGFTSVKGSTGTVFTMPVVDTAGSYTDGMARRVMATSPANIEILMAFIPDTTQENFFGIMVRGDGTIGSAVKSRDANCQFIELSVNTSATINLTRTTASAATGVGTGTGAWTNGTLSYLRAAAFGINYYGKAWPSTIPEPIDWHMKLQDPVMTGLGTRWGIGLSGGASTSVIYTATVCGLWAWEINGAMTSLDASDYPAATVVATGPRPRLMRV